MNKHYRHMLDLVSEENLFKATKDIIEEALTDSWPDDTVFTLYLTAGQFRKLNGFYASQIVMEELVSPYIGRIIKFYVMRNPAAAKYGLDVIAYSEENQSKAATRLITYFTQKYGPVSPERTKEIDEIGHSWRLQSNLELGQVIETGEFKQNKAN